MADSDASSEPPRPYFFGKAMKSSETQLALNSLHTTFAHEGSMLGGGGGVVAGWWDWLVLLPLSICQLPQSRRRRRKGGRKVGRLSVVMEPLFSSWLSQPPRQAQERGGGKAGRQGWGGECLLPVTFLWFQLNGWLG